MPLWLITMSYALASIVAGMVFPRLEYTYLPQFEHGMAVSSAQALLSATGSGMMALTAIVFSLGFVIIQFSGTAYSPRLATWFARDPLLFHSLGTFIATFVYALATLTWVDRDKNGYVPLFSTLLVLLLIIVSTIMLVQLALRVGELQITFVLRFIGKNGRRVIDALPPLDKESARILLWPSQTPAQTIHYSGVPRSVAFIDFDRLLALAVSSSGAIALSFCTGDTLTEGMELFRVYETETPISEAALLQSVRLESARTFEQDPKYALRLLVDIAIKALSPAINDPTTAVQSLDQIEDLLYRLQQRRLDAWQGVDAAGQTRVFVPTSTWEDYLSLAFDEIRICGASQVQVMRRMRAALNDLESAAAVPSRTEAVRRYLHRLDGTVDASTLDANDRIAAHAADRQGIGVSR